MLDKFLGTPSPVSQEGFNDRFLINKKGDKRDDEPAWGFAKSRSMLQLHERKPAPKPKLRAYQTKVVNDVEPPLVAPIPFVHMEKFSIRRSTSISGSIKIKPGILFGRPPYRPAKVAKNASSSGYGQRKPAVDGEF